MERYNSQIETPNISVWSFEERVHDLNEAELHDLIYENTHTTEELSLTAAEVIGLFHGAEPRINGEPYYRHPLRVAARILIEFGIDDETVLTAALHHDTIENRPMQYSGDRNREEAMSYMELVDYEMAEVVNGLTNSEYPIDISQAEKNDLYFKHVVEYCNQDERVLIVKLSDFIDNAGRLNVLEDEAIRQRLAKKYFPLVEYFSERLDGEDITLLSEEKKIELKQYLSYIGDLLVK